MHLASCRVTSHRVRVRGWVRGFTLIELLVVTSIIAMLVAVLLPALARAKVQSQTVMCLGNMRQMGVAWSNYTVDNRTFPQNCQEGTYWSKPFGQAYLYSGCQSWMTYGDVFPDAFRFTGNPSTPSQYSGMGMLWSYIRQPKIYYCPGNPRSEDWYKYFWRGDIPTGGTDGYWGFERQGRGAMTTYFYRSSMYYSEASPYSVSSIDFNYSAQTVKKPDDPGVANKTMLADFWDCYVVDGNIELNPETVPHGGGVSNILATDGHAKIWRLPDNILPIWNFWDATYSAPGFDNYSWTGQLPWWWVEADKAIR